MKEVTENSYKYYHKFVNKWCPKQDKKIVMCNDCRCYKGKCTHPSHPKEPLFTEV